MRPCGPILPSLLLLGCQQGQPSGFRNATLDAEGSDLSALDTGAPPTACPDPPADAVIFEGDAYYATQWFYLDTLGWAGLLLQWREYNTTRSDCYDSGWDDNWAARVDGSLYASMIVDLPAAYPPTYEGLCEVRRTSAYGTQPGMDLRLSSIDSGVVETRSNWVDFDFGSPGYASLCLSRVRKHRISGAVLMVPGVDAEATTSIYYPFDLVYDPDAPLSGTNCMYTYNYGATEDQIWDPAWWDTYDPTTNMGASK